MMPPKAGVAPASTTIRGSQVNIEYVISEVMPNISVMPQASGVFQTLPCGALDGSLAALIVSGCGRARESISHGSAAASDISAQMPSDTRQPACCATGTASRAGIIVPICNTVM